ncbi:MAG: polyphosphate kinase 2 family protein [Rickettsiales bacterium]
MKIDSKNFCISSGKKLQLSSWPTEVDTFYKSKNDCKEKLQKSVERLDELQNKLYASGKQSVLIIFQAMDAAGKDSIIRHTLTGLNPQGIEVHSFKTPSQTELKHDFLWRTTQCLPEKGKIGVFNRSYYEEVLIVKVHPQFLAAQSVELPKNQGSFWKERYQSINDFEKHLCRNGTHILKFHLHLSKEEQARRFLSRIDEPAKNWKFNTADVEEREYWDAYQSAYQDCIQATSTPHAPWYIIPADDKWNARLIVSRILLEKAEKINPCYPHLKPEHVKEMKRLRQILVKQVKD